MADEGPLTCKIFWEDMAEREGFEPPIPFQVCPLSRRIVSTTHAPLRVVVETEELSALLV